MNSHRRKTVIQNKIQQITTKPKPNRKHQNKEIKLKDYVYMYNITLFLQICAIKEMRKRVEFEHEAGDKLTDRNRLI